MIDLDGAIKTHAEWKTKFRAAISKEETMDVATIAKDDSCMLGKWLYDEAKQKYADLESYKTLVARHTAFHVQAGKVANFVNAHQYREAEAALSVGTPYMTASNEVGQSIIRLRKETGL
jgi:methyl-accepting chemotaxis protein